MARRMMLVISGRSWHPRLRIATRQFAWSYSPRSASVLKVWANPVTTVFAATIGMGRNRFPVNARPAAASAAPEQELGSRVSMSTCSWIGAPSWARWIISRQSAPCRCAKVSDEVSRAAVSTSVRLPRRSAGIRSKSCPLAIARAAIAALRTGSCSVARISMRAKATTIARESRLRSADARIACQAAPRSSASLEFRQGSATARAWSGARWAANRSCSSRP